MAQRIAGLSVLVLAIWFLYDTGGASAQVGGGEEDWPQLHLNDVIDMRVMFTALEDEGLATDLRNELTSRSSYHLAFVHTGANTTGPRDYDGAILIGNTAPATRISIDYDYSESSGMYPTLPPDTMSFSSASITPPATTKIILPNRLAFEFLLAAWSGKQGDMEQPLANYDLTELWVEITGSPGSETVVLRLVYRNALTMFPRSISGQHLGGYQFGTLTTS